MSYQTVRTVRRNKNPRTRVHVVAWIDRLFESYISTLRTSEARREVQFRSVVPWEYTAWWHARLPQSHTLKITVDWCHWCEKKKCSGGEGLSQPSIAVPSLLGELPWRIFRVSPTNATDKSYRISWNTRNDGPFKPTKRLHDRSIDYCYTTNNRVLIFW